MKNLCAVVLAAGRGTRMGGDLPKVLYDLAGKPIILWTLETLKDCGFGEILIVVGYKSELIQNVVTKAGFEVKFVKQKELLGTANSLELGLRSLSIEVCDVVVLFGDDSAFYKRDTIRDFVKFHDTRKNIGTFLVSYLSKPNPIGGLEIDNRGKVSGVLTKSEIEGRGLRSYAVLCGMFCFDKEWIQGNISKVEKSTLSGEYPLPAIYKVALNSGQSIDTFVLKDSNEWMSINTVEELKAATKQKERNL